MQYTPKLRYANKAAQALAEKVYAQTAAETLEVQLKVHLDLNKRDPGMLASIASCMAGKREFILYQDFTNYTIFIPESRLAVCFKDGKEYTRDVTKKHRQWEERVKMAMMAYDNFFEPAKAINNGEATTLLQLQ